MLCLKNFCSMTQGWQLKNESKIRKQCHVYKNNREVFKHFFNPLQYSFFGSQGVCKPLLHQEWILAAPLTSVRSYCYYCCCKKALSSQVNTGSTQSKPEKDQMEARPELRTPSTPVSVV